MGGWGRREGEFTEVLLQKEMKKKQSVNFKGVKSFTVFLTHDAK